MGTGTLTAGMAPPALIWNPPGPVARNTPAMIMSMANSTVVLAWLKSCSGGADQYKFLSEDWAFSLPGYTLGTIILPPNPPYPNCMTETSGRQDSPGVYGLSSYHPGGVNVALADGSVRFVTNSIQPQTWRALGTRAGGEVVPAW